MMYGLLVWIIRLKYGQKEKAEVPFLEPEEFSQALQEVLGKDWEADIEPEE